MIKLHPRHGSVTAASKILRLLLLLLAKTNRLDDAPCRSALFRARIRGVR
jgi:hypothetical protein